MPLYVNDVCKGFAIFDQISDFINGVCLRNPTITAKGKLKLYPPGYQHSLYFIS
jgi:hypothetical protein